MSDDAELIRALDAFAAEWNSGETVPRISGYLKSCGAGDRVRRRLAMELIKLDLEERWQRGLRRTVEDYADDVAELSLLITPDLLLEEYRIRKRAGDQVSTGEYMQRFPQLAAGLRRAFRVDPSMSLTRSLEAAIAKPTALEPGDRIDDFELLVRLGQGTFAQVFLARQQSMQRLVAVKVSADEGLEPQTLAQLDHEHIIRVYDQRRLTEPRVRLLYMQYAAGGTLLDVLQQLRTLARTGWNGAAFLRAIDRTLESRGESPPESVHRARLRELGWPEVVGLLGAQLARGLDYAHRRGVLHRDLKPANILLTAEGLPKLADFNVSFGAGVEGDSAGRNFGGSIAYMSPEQLEICHPARLRPAEDLDARSDQYALGVVLLELLSGERPFRHDNGATTWASKLESLIDSRRAAPEPMAMAALSAGDRSGLSDVLRRMLHPDREQRYRSCGEVAAALELCLMPSARQLLRVPADSWRSTVQRWPGVSVVGATLLPNAVAAVFNFLYNRNEIRLQLPAAEPTFMRVQSLINLVAFPVGILCVGWLIRSVTHRSGQDALQRVACLQLGVKASLVGLTLWLIAAPAYPLLLRMLLPAVPVAIYGHFTVSLIVCGLIASAYPFLLVSLIALRCLLPVSLPEAALTPCDREALNRLARHSWIALTLAALVPMVAVLVLALSGLDRRQTLAVLAAAGTAGFGVAVTAFRLLQRDTETLLRLPAAQNERGSEAL